MIITNSFRLRSAILVKLTLIVAGLAFIVACAPSTSTAPVQQEVSYQKGLGKNIKRIAVLDFEFDPPKWYPQSDIESLVQSTQRPIKNGSAILTDSFMSEMMRLGKYQLVERNALENILNELKLSASGLTKDEMNQLGEILQIDGLVMGKVNYFTEQSTAMVYKKIRVSLTVRLVDIKSASVVWMVSDELDLTKTTPVQAANQLCRRMVAKIGNLQ